MTKMVPSREFNQDTGGAKRAARDGPVVITERGKPAFVLLSYAEYRTLTGKFVSLADALAHTDPAVADIDLELPERPRHSSLRVPDFS